MRIFLAGASGAVGKRLVPALVIKGHQVAGMVHSPGKADWVKSMGAEPIVANGLDADAVQQAVARFRPEVIINQMTALSPDFNPREFDQVFATTNRLRTEGNDNLLAAAKASGVRRFIAQSYAGWPYARTGGPVKRETDPLDPNPPQPMRNTLTAIRHLESATSESGLEGIILRYGSFYGPGTTSGGMLDQIRKRRMPVVGNGGAIWSFLHIDDAAHATVAAAEGGAPGVYNVVDEEPATVASWLPELARLTGSQPPHHVPVWLARFLIGEAGVIMMTTTRGASNQKAKMELGWTPFWKSWRDGFRNEIDEKREAKAA